MKRSFIIVSVIMAALYSCEQSNQDSIEGYYIKGVVQELEDSTMITLKARADGKWLNIDSTYSDGLFEFNGKVDAPELYFIQVGASRSYISFFIENSEIEITATNRKLDEAEIIGSGIQDIFSSYEDERDGIMENVRTLYYTMEDEKAAGNTTIADSMARQISGLYSEIDMLTRQYMLDNVDNSLGPFLATQVYYNDEEIEEADSVANLFSGEALVSTYFKDFSTNLKTWKSVAVGQQAPNWEQNDQDGKPVSFSDIQQRYVLIDFWASWCGPCRQENPYVVEMYNEYKGKGFEIIGVSLDESREKWLEAIDKDGLEWYHVSDLKGWSNEVGDLYGVKAIPHTVLVDQDGIIIAKNLRGESLRRKLEELL